MPTRVNVSLLMRLYAASAHRLLFIYCHDDQLVTEMKGNEKKYGEWFQPEKVLKFKLAKNLPDTATLICIVVLKTLVKEWEI